MRFNVSKRNIVLFYGGPNDFMFQLNKREFENWRSQIVTSNSDKMGLRRFPYAFTEQGGFDNIKRLGEREKKRIN